MIPLLAKILSDWGLSCLHDLFEGNLYRVSKIIYEIIFILFLDQYILTIEDFLSLSENDIDYIIPEVGLRNKLKKGLQDYKVNNAKDNLKIISLPGTSAKRTFVQTEEDALAERHPVPTPTEKNKKHDNVLNWNVQFANKLNLQTLLESNANGGLVMSYKSVEFPGRIKSLLVRVIVDEFIENRVNMGTNEFKAVAQKIKQLFPKENPDEYFLPDEDGVRPRGKLAERFYNVVKELKNQNVLLKTKPTTKNKSIFLLIYLIN